MTANELGRRAGRGDHWRDTSVRTGHAPRAMLRQAGLRATVGRMALIELFDSMAPQHLTVAQLFSRMHADGMAFDESAVYRMIADFTQRGIIHVLPEQGSRAYGLADPPHHHVVCGQCGVVIEIPAGDLLVAVDGVELPGFQL
ncbi:MAG: transcriptional repressor, partial [Pseudonocardia sp.]|nr:transcriptional repressor [Pseudonocardia sp.]